MKRRFTKYPSNYVKASSDSFDSDLWRKCALLHNKLFDYFGFDSEDEDYDKYVQEDAVSGIYSDMSKGVEPYAVFNDVFNDVYATDIPKSVFIQYYKKVFV